MGKSLLVFLCVAFLSGCIEQIPNGARNAGAGLTGEGEGGENCLNCQNGVCRVINDVPACVHTDAGTPDAAEGEGEGGNADATVPDDSDAGQLPDVSEPETGEGEGEGTVGEGEGEGQSQLARYGESCALGADCESGICLQVGQELRCTQPCGDCPPIDDIEMSCVERICIPRGVPCERLNVGDPCSAGLGVCRREGRLVCNEAGDGVTCDAVPASHAGELCGNQLDDDCDGATDEGFPGFGDPCEVNVQACVSRGRNICSEDRMGLVCDAPAITPAAERCNDSDDDCDGQTDEDFSVGDVCTVGVGICERQGVIECDVEQRGFACSVNAGDPEQFESCDELDNDCDGQTDEEVDLDRDTFFDAECGGLDCNDRAQSVNPDATEDCGNAVDDDCDARTDAVDLEDCGPCQPNERRQCGQTDVGECEFGEQVCGEDFVWGPCDRAIAPVAESCDGFDNDCDGDADETWPTLGDECGEGVGICERFGHIVCTGDGTDVVCDAVPGDPSLELCGNAVDDDCNGATDEGFDVGADCVNGLGICERSGQKVCSGDETQTVCNAVPGQPQVEACNGTDDDCDGVVNNGNPGGGVGCDAGDGICEAGITDCSDGQIVCQRLQNPRPETCNSLDDDCNGVVDNGFPVSDGCTVGIGACQRAGQLVCTGDGSGTTCNAVAGQPVAELCGNGTDDDCDANTDEGFDVGAACSVGIGACLRNGNKVCSGDRTTTECNAVAGQPGVELCGNAVDDDCDGDTDEGFPTVGQACSAGVGECLRNGQIVCDGAGTRCNAVAGNPVAERCDGLDNDCSGASDNGFALGQACTNGAGVCQRAGQTVCNAGQDDVECNAVPGNPVAELCGNAVDDDCDGNTDEGFDVGAACSVGVGACARNGNKVCSGDRTTTECNVAAGAPGSETCNNVDDDCDGSTDESEDTGMARVTAGNATWCIDLYEASDNGAGVARSVSGVVPWSSASWNTANAACAAAGKRLCTKVEWCQASGADANCNGRTYPWGAAALVCARANYVDCGNALKNTGQHPTGVSPSGVHDLVGNLWEWTSEQSGGNRILRGAGYQSGSEDVHLGVSASLAPASTNPWFGFRCCDDP